MSQQGFVHLHVHSQYSLLESTIRVRELCQRAAEWEMPAVALTDSDNLYGAIDFYFEARSAGLKPILGCELSFAPGGRSTIEHRRPGQEPQVFKLVALCKNLEGYENLCQIVTRSYTEAAEIKGAKAVAVDRSLLKKYHEGLILLSGGLKSELAYKILKGEEEEAERTALWFKEVFGKDYFLEIQDTAIPEQDHVNDVLERFSKKNKIPLVAASQCHYLDPGDAEPQEVLQCIEVNRNLDFDRPPSLVPQEFYFKNAQVMRERFERFAGACDATLEIAERCDVKFQFTDKDGKPIYHLPDFRPEGMKEGAKFNAEKYLRDQTKSGLERRFGEACFKDLVSAKDWPEKKKEYFERLKFELDMIIRTGFAGYFLIVADFINWAKERAIPVGPGRGSGAGSLVAYSLRITDLDPIQFNLLFERFINPERISMPDFDVDFCQDRRGEVIEYVTQKYGKENVSQIITFGKLLARQVIKDVGRILGMPFAETDQITKLIPNELNITLESALEKEPKLVEVIEGSPKLSKLMSYARKLEGLSRNAGVHAAGVIITKEPVVHYCPLFVGKEGSIVTQFDKDFGEKIGLVKFDFLGLKTLTVVDHAVRFIREGATGKSPEAQFSIETINMEDAKVFELIGAADTDGVFQVESSGMKDLCLRIQPNSIEDLTAINALFRPGPLGSGMVDQFIECKHGRMPIEYELPQLEPILKETYGVILYQEQVMRIARELAGYSLGQADMLRRAMGKKKAEEMARHQEIFVEGAKKKGIPEVKAKGIYDLMAKFAQYGFNKSHSAAYAVLTYQTAYLKTYYPAEFMAALMTTEMNNTDKLTKYISDARSHKIPVLPPDVNGSLAQFSVEVLKPDHPLFPKGRQDKEAIKGVRFGLEAIKGVGGIAVEEIINGRKENPYEDVVEFCTRVPTRKVNKKVLESLVLAGALDSISKVNRASLFGSIEKVISHATDEQEERALGQSSLFDQFSAEEIKLVTPADTIFAAQPDWPQSEKLAKEKQVVGFYVSGHPMESWQQISEDWLGWSVAKIKKYGETKPPSGSKKQVSLIATIAGMREIMTRKGKKMAFVQIEDFNDKMEVIFFPDGYAESADHLKMAMQKAEPVVISGDLEVRDDVTKILANDIKWAKEAHKGQITRMIVRLRAAEVSVEQLRELKSKLLTHRGKCPVSIEFEDTSFATNLTLSGDLKVAASPKLSTTINQIFGKPVVSLH